MSSSYFCFSKYLATQVALFFAIVIWLIGSNIAIAQSNDGQPPVAPQEREPGENDLTNMALLDDTDDPDGSDEEVASEPTFTIGSKGPALDIEHWISDNDGKFEHVKELKSGKVYVIEFWATWCGPCISSMPHLSELQEKFTDKGVQIISVSDEDMETINEFLDKKVKGKDITYRELTNNYCLTTDPDGSVSKDYFEASGQEGIPTAFIVGKEGLLEWIGHPMDLDEPLEEIVDGTWDREAFKEQMEADDEGGFPPEFAEFMETIQKASELAESGDTDEALKLIDDAISKSDSDEIKEMFSQVRVQFVILYVGGDEAVKALKKLAEEASDDPISLGDMLNMLSIVHEQKPLDEAVLNAAKEIGEKGVEQHADSFMIHFGLSKILNIQKESDRAIEAAQKAIELIDEYEPEAHEEDWLSELSDEITQFLEQLKSEK